MPGAKCAIGQQIGGNSQPVVYEWSTIGSGGNFTARQPRSFAKLRAGTQLFEVIN
ncbi:hypothetical protein HC766_07595 [Candidatus Gracilibacteria bacterium]|nr:hypothetical protein [Candidatus Gracilibacteria bacterium]